MLGVRQSRTMASPRLRAAVPLPTPIDTSHVRRILGARMLTGLLVWVLPALLASPSWLTAFGIPDPGTTHLVFMRLWGAVSFGTVVGQAFACRMPARHIGTLLVTIIADGMSAIVLFSVGAGGAFSNWSRLAEVYAWTSALAWCGFAVGLTVSGQSLLRRLAERPRSSSMKIV